MLSHTTQILRSNNGIKAAFISLPALYAAKNINISQMKQTTKQFSSTVYHTFNIPLEKVI